MWRSEVLAQQMLFLCSSSLSAQVVCFSCQDVYNIFVTMSGCTGTPVLVPEASCVFCACPKSQPWSRLKQLVVTGNTARDGR